MQADRWQRVKDIFGAVLERPAQEREAFLQQACIGDGDLRRDVDSLLTARAEAGAFLSGPASLGEMDRPPSLTPDSSEEITSSARLPIGARLGPYEVVSFLAAGGMGEVYKARDTRLDRLVAIKVLPPDFAADPQRAGRFEREARIISRLNHPHICALYDVGHHDGASFLVMEYLEGENLADRLRSGPLPLEEALEYARQIAEALEEAHQHGVVHRDLKPANILLTKQGAKLLDFGIARRQPDEATGSSRPRTLTGEGLAVGTPGYMAPEQLEGKDVDERTDIFAFGLLVHEMVTGERPFPGREPLAPPALEGFVQRCLARDPADRWPSCGALLAALATVGRTPSRRRLAVVAVVGGLLFAAALALWTLRERRALPAGTPGKSIAVLPFQNLSPSPESAYFADGMTEDILTQLAKIQDMKVIARTSVMRYKDTIKPVREIASELGVGAVLEGSVRRSGNRVRITGQLIDASTEQHIWAEIYDRDMQDVFAVQSEVAQRIASALHTRLTAPEKERIEKRPTTSVEAYDLYVQGRELYNRYRKDDNEEAIVLFQKAVALDPQFALGWAGLGGAYGQRAIRFGFPESWVDSGIEASRTALRNDPALAEGYQALATNLSRQGRLQEALEAARKAVELKPSYAPAVASVASNLFNLGQLDEAISWSRRSVELDPRSGLRMSILGAFYDALGDPARAEAALRRALELQAEIGQSNWSLVMFLLRQGRKGEALEHARKALASAPGDSYTLHAAAVAELMAGDPARARELFERQVSRNTPGSNAKVYLASLYRRSGRIEDAEKLLDKTLELHHRLLASGNGYHAVPLEIAFVHAARGDKDEALRWLERARQAGWRGWEQANWSPLFDPLRQDDRFRDLMRRIDEDVAAMRRRAGL